MVKKLKVQCKCGESVSITVKEAGQFIAGLRTKPVDREAMSRAGKKGMASRWGKNKSL